MAGRGHEPVTLVERRAAERRRPGAIMYRSTGISWHLIAVTRNGVLEFEGAGRRIAAYLDRRGRSEVCTCWRALADSRTPPCPKHHGATP
jgi:hypothetical protein